MGKDKPHPREDICKHLTSKNWYSEYLKNSYEFKIMGKKTGNENYNYDSCLKPTRLARIKKSDIIKYCQGCKVNLLQCWKWSTLGSKLNIHTLVTASLLLQKFSNVRKRLAQQYSWQHCL